jgi:hypothetical protein
MARIKENKAGKLNSENRQREVEQREILLSEVNFLSHQLADEEKRRETIEGKTGQLLGQVSIVISIVALFIPLLSDELNVFPLWQKVLAVMLFISVVIAFIVSIWIASTTWIINKYGYLRADLADFYKCGKPRVQRDFLNQHKSLLTEMIPQHVKVNNLKGTKLIRAGIAFRLGILLLGILSVLLSIALTVNTSSPTVIETINATPY